MVVSADPSAGASFRAEHDALTLAGRTHLPAQADTVDGIRQRLDANRVPNEAFAQVEGSSAASAGHTRNLDDGVAKLSDAVLRLRGTGDKITGADDQYRAFDADRAGSEDDEGAELIQARAGGTPRTSVNGWPVDGPMSAHTIPGTNVRARIADGDAGEVLMDVARQYNETVEPVDRADGYSLRPIRGSNTGRYSNHSSGTAIDLNPDDHGQHLSGTFTPAQVNQIHNIVGATGGVVRWGGDYHAPTPVDEMHFEINASPAAVAAYAAQLRAARGR